jgi:hypothetical protein
VQAQTASYPTSGPSHGRGPSGASNDSSITSAFSTLSLGNYNVAPGSLNTDTASYYNHPPTVRTDSDGSYVAVNHAYTPTQASGYMITQASYTPYQQPEVDSQTSGYTHSTSPTHIARPSDGELLQNVGREVVLNPDAHNTPPDFPLLSKGLWPHRILRGSQGTHSSKEKLKPSQSSYASCSHTPTLTRFQASRSATRAIASTGAVSFSECSGPNWLAMLGRISRLQRLVRLASKLTTKSDGL